MSTPAWCFDAEAPFTTLELTPLRREQLAQLDSLYFDDIGEGSILAMTEAAQTGGKVSFWVERSSMWTLVGADGTPRYEVFMYGGDSGSAFKAGTTDLVAEIIQCGLQSYDDDARAAIAEAHEGLDRATAANYTLRWAT